MAKPSIFSKDYERRMKKRKRNTILGVIVALIVVGVVIFNTKIKNIDFSNIRASLQAWVDSGNEDETKDTVPEETSNDSQEKKEPEKNYLDITIAEGVTTKAEYTETNGVKTFISVNPVDNISFCISPAKDKILFVDAAQNMKIIDTAGQVTDLTKTEYVSNGGQSFPKDQVLASTPGYIWCQQAKFIDDTKIAYVSQLPYFGKQTQYVWIKDITSGSETTLWNVAGGQIVLGDLVQNSGLAITVDGNAEYLLADGSVVPQQQAQQTQNPEANQPQQNSAENPNPVQ